MFKNERQQARVCDALCRTSGLEGMWDEEGPTDVSIALLENNGGPLSSGERIVFLASWSIWNGEGNAQIGDVIHRLDERNLRAIGTLLLAVATGSSSAIDRWLSDFDAAGAKRGARRS